MPFGFIALNKTLNYSFEFERRLFQERVVLIKFGIYVSIALLNSIASLNRTMKSIWLLNLKSFQTLGMTQDSFLLRPGLWETTLIHFLLKYMVISAFENLPNFKLLWITDCLHWIWQNIQKDLLLNIEKINLMHYSDFEVIEVISNNGYFKGIYAFCRHIIS
jgi:hypothetical protein